LDDFHHKMRKTGRHCAAVQPTRQSMHLTLLSASGWLPAAFRAVAMTIIAADRHTSCASPALDCLAIFALKLIAVLL
jgi:hypothetical protein